MYIQRRAFWVRMEVSRGAAYGLGLSQFAIAIGIVIFSPPVKVDVYMPRAYYLNATGGSFLYRTDKAKVHMGLPVTSTSFLAAIFSMVTCKVVEQGMTGQDYQQDVLDQMGMWDTLFWIFCMAAHGIVIVMVCSPVDVFGLVSATAFMSFFVYRMCAPKSQTMNLTQENLNLLGYGLGVLQAAYQITDVRANGVTILMLITALDYCLGHGHTYDRQATIETVSNCRIFYICAGAIGCSVLYATGG